ncbi:MAG TPA: hypothetical protein VKF38_12090 [Anaerolineaceae bacterium]|nr:hypothetical protein [Anaerolineaceae bacterium]
MKTAVKARSFVMVCVVTVWLVSSLSCGLPLSGPAPTADSPTATRTQAGESHATPKVSATQAPTATSAASTSEAAVAATESATATLAPTRPSQPVVVASYCDLADCSQYTYPGDESNGIRGGTGGIMLAIPGQIWIANDFVGIQQWDPQTGKLVKTIANTVENYFSDIKYDGQQVWVYALVLKQTSANSEYTGVLYAIDPLQGELVKKIDIPNEKKETISNNDAIGFPYIGVSPGKVWDKDRLIDTRTFEATVMPWNFMFGTPIFAYDGQGMMWVEGDVPPGATQTIWIYDVNDPTKPLGKNGTAGLTSNPDLTDHHNLIMAGGKMWATARYWKKVADQTSYWELLAYDIHPSDKPLFKTDISKEMTGRNGGEILAADNHAIWLAPNGQDGKVYYYDQANGQLLGSLHVGALIFSMSFDGQNLWVMDDEHGLEKIALPWAP